MTATPFGGGRRQERHFQGEVMDKLVRCTVCTWRGTFMDAQLAPRVPRSDLPPPMLEHQEVYEAAHVEKTLAGAPKPPPCPSCGHHITSIHKRRPGSLHP
jgi:hypothetical protein